MEFINRYRRRLETFSYNYRAFISGSASEIPAAYFLTEPTDFDFMMHRVDVCAVPKNTQPLSDFKVEVLTIEPQHFSPGYVRLKKSKFNSQSTDREQDYQKHLYKHQYENLNGPAITSELGRAALTFDRVLSVQCPYWPPEAQEWLTRYRPHGWPSKDLIDQIVSEGCFLVGKSHPNCKDDDETQWRYSFSKAEMRLISSWTDSQMYVYHVLRLIKSEIVKKFADRKKTGLCTYHFKTQMFWACEEKPAEFWKESNLLTCICELLTRMEQRFTDRNLPNYFLRDCNIIAGNIYKNDLSEAIRMLNTESGQSFLKSKLPPKVCHECRIYISFPVENALYYHLLEDRFGFPFQTHRPKLGKVRQLIDEEMDDLMNGIYNMQLGKTPGDSYYQAAEQHFWKGIAETVNRKRVELSNRISLNTITAVHESLENAQLLTTLEGKNKWDLPLVISCKKCPCPYAEKFRSFHWNEEKATFEQKWLNPTAMLSAAYLSNLYFTTGNYDLCNEMVNEEYCLAADAFNTELFPMIICHELAPLFDENLQEVLGFLWLCKHLLGGDGIVFEFCTCPQLFLCYIRIQSSLRLGDMDLVDVAVSTFNEHRHRCKFSFHLYPYHYVLLEMAWRIRIRP